MALRLTPLRVLLVDDENYMRVFVSRVLSRSISCAVAVAQDGQEALTLCRTHDPELIILDEPMNGLDPQGIADVRNLINHLSKDLGKTVFISSHLLSEMEQVADSLLIIHKGKKIAEGRSY